MGNVPRLHQRLFSGPRTGFGDPTRAASNVGLTSRRYLDSTSRKAIGVNWRTRALVPGSSNRRLLLTGISGCTPWRVRAVFGRDRGRVADDGKASFSVVRVGCYSGLMGWR